MDLPNREELENVKASHCLQKNDVRIQHMLRGFFEFKKKNRSKRDTAPILDQVPPHNLFSQ
jgi:hypothetical protein